MPAHWSIEDGQVIPLVTFTGDDHPHAPGRAARLDRGERHSAAIFAGRHSRVCLQRDSADARERAAKRIAVRR